MVKVELQKHVQSGEKIFFEKLNPSCVMSSFSLSRRWLCVLRPYFQCRTAVCC